MNHEKTIEATIQDYISQQVKGAEVFDEFYQAVKEYLSKEKAKDYWIAYIEDQRTKHLG